METRDWRVWQQRTAESLAARSGAGVEEWNARVRVTGIDSEPALRAWLADQGVTGYAQQVLVHERFGYPDFLTATADELLEAQYADRPALRPVYDRVVLAAQSLGDVTVQVRKTYVSLLTPRRTFAVVKPTTLTRVDLGLRLDGEQPSGRLQPAKGLANDTINLRVGLTSPADVDDEVLDLLRRAYAASA